MGRYVTHAWTDISLIKDPALRVVIIAFPASLHPFAISVRMVACMMGRFAKIAMLQAVRHAVR
jgi:hypothetical protein